MDIEIKEQSPLPSHPPRVARLWQGNNMKYKGLEHTALCTSYRHFTQARSCCKILFFWHGRIWHVCSVSLGCNVGPCTIRVKNVFGQREPPTASDGREHCTQTETRKTVSVLLQQPEQKKTSRKYNLLSAAGCCHEWQKQICLAALSGW